MASSSSHCVPHTKPRFWGPGYPVVHVVRLILPQLFFIYLTLSYRHLNSLTPRTLTPTAHNKFLHGPYLAFITLYNCLPFESLNLNYFTLWESLPVSSLCLIPNTAFYVINVSNSWRVIFYTNYQLFPGVTSFFTKFTYHVFIDFSLTPILCCPFVALALPEPDSGLRCTHCPMWWPVTIATFQMAKYYTAQIIEHLHHHRKFYWTAMLYLNN